MNSHTGRYTAKGGHDVETAIAAILEDVTKTLSPLMRAESYRTLALIGGYGKGEGGVELVDGIERPHNNLDLLLITRNCDRAAQDAIKATLDPVLVELSRKHEIGMDLGVTAEETLAHAPCLVMWYDMRFGHHTLLGDPQFLPGLTQFSAENLLASDIRDLLVNRGSLVIINDMLLARYPDPPRNIRRTIIKHAMKAIIGYGDALLFFRGEYNWSYVEKLRRMQLRTDVSDGFQTLYQQACNFRFNPDYAPFEQIDLLAWGKELCGELEKIHLICESARLHTSLKDWNEYASKCFSAALMPERVTLRSVAVRVRNLIRDRRKLGATGSQGLSLISQLGCLAGGQKAMLSTVFPAVLYADVPVSFLQLTAGLLEASGTDPDAIRRAYLKRWGHSNDVNFHITMERLGLQLESAIEPVPQESSVNSNAVGVVKHA